MTCWRRTTSRRSRRWCGRIRFWTWCTCNYAPFGAEISGQVTGYDAAPARSWQGLADVGSARIAAAGEIPPRLLFQYLLCSGLAIRRSLFTAIGGWDERMAGIRGEDWEFTLRATARGRVGLLKAPLARYREHDGHKLLSPERMTQGWLHVLQFARAHHQAAAEPPLRDALDGAIRHARYLCLSESCKARNWKAARRFARELRQDRPGLAARLKLLVLRLPDGLAGLLFRLWHAGPWRASRR